MFFKSVFRPRSRWPARQDLMAGFEMVAMGALRHLPVPWSAGVLKSQRLFPAGLAVGSAFIDYEVSRKEP